LRYLRWLRDPARRSARSEAAATYAEAKTQLPRTRIEEKQRKLVRRTDVDALIDQIVGIVVTHRSGMAARCSNDLVCGARSTPWCIRSVKRSRTPALMKQTSSANRHATHTDRMFDSHQGRLPNAVLTYFVILRL